MQEYRQKGPCHVVCVLAIYSNDSSSNPSDVYSFKVKKNVINKKEAGVVPFLRIQTKEVTLAQNRVKTEWHLLDG